MRRLTLLALTFGIPAALVGQTGPISPAMINYAEGRVVRERPANSPATELGALQSGQHVKTDAGRAEMFLAFDSVSFVRLGGSSHLEFLEVGEASATLILHSGSMIVDTDGYDHRDAVAVRLGGIEARIDGNGEYRFEATSGPEGLLSVLSGEAVVSANGQSFRIGAGQAAKVSGQSVEVHVASDFSGDPLAEWNQERSAIIAEQMAEMARSEEAGSVYSKSVRRPNGMSFRSWGWGRSAGIDADAWIVSEDDSRRPAKK